MTDACPYIQPTAIVSHQEEKMLKKMEKKLSILTQVSPKHYEICMYTVKFC